MDKLIIERDNLRLLKAILETAKCVSKKEEVNNIFYHPVWIADRIASMEGDVNYTDLIEVICDLVNYQLQETEKAVKDHEQKEAS